MQYLYIARRDKSAVEIIGIFKNQSKASSPQIIPSVHLLAVDDKKKFELTNYYENKKQLWEIFLENFENFVDFRNRMTERRYKNIPASGDPKLFHEGSEIMKLENKKQKVMLQRKIFPDSL